MFDKNFIDEQLQKYLNPSESWNKVEQPKPDIRSRFENQAIRNVDYGFQLKIEKNMNFINVLNNRELKKQHQ